MFFGWPRPTEKMFGTSSLVGLLQTPSKSEARFKRGRCRTGNNGVLKLLLAPTRDHLYGALIIGLPPREGQEPKGPYCIRGPCLGPLWAAQMIPERCTAAVALVREILRPAVHQVSEELPACHGKKQASACNNRVL